MEAEDIPGSYTNHTTIDNCIRFLQGRNEQCEGVRFQNVTVEDDRARWAVSFMVRKTPFPSPFYILKTIVFAKTQDRLGTNIGKVENKDAFSAGSIGECQRRAAR